MSEPTTTPEPERPTSQAALPETGAPASDAEVAPASEAAVSALSPYGGSSLESPTAGAPSPAPSAPSPVPSPASAGDSPADPVARRRERRGGPRVPLWAWLTAGLVVAAGVVLAVLAGSGAFTPEPLPTPPAPTVTAAPPTPTLEPVAREGEATVFSAALPDTVLDLALADFAPGSPLDEAKPLESYTLVYSDGGARSVTVYAAQFPDAEAAAAALPQEGTETGEVSAGGAVVGEWVLVGSYPGTEQPALVWRNSTAVLVVTGEEQLARDVFTVFPL